MKLVGIGLILCGSTGMGIWMYEHFKTRIRCLEQIIWLFHYMESEISYQKSSLGMIFERAAKRMAEPYAGALRSMAHRMQHENGEYFSTIWKNELEKLSDKIHLEKEDMEVLKAFASEGYQDIHMQLIQIRMTREKLEQRKQQLESEVHEKRKIYVCVGMMSGLVVSIILI